MTLLMIDAVAARGSGDRASRLRVPTTETIGQATLRGLAALLLPMMRAASRPIETGADAAADHEDLG